MKKLLITVLLITSYAFAQDKPKQDTIVAVQMNIQQFRALLTAIDQNIDSKKASKELIEFLTKSAQIVQPKDKPKEKQ